MSSSLTAVIIVTAVIFTAFAWMIINMNRTQKASFRRELLKRWGHRPEAAPGASYPLHYADSDASVPAPDDTTAGEERPVSGKTVSRYALIDDITWQDVEMDRLLSVLDVTWTSCGKEVLAAWMRRPVTDGTGELESRDRLMSLFEENEEKRRAAADILFRSGLREPDSVYGALMSVTDSKPAAAGPYLAAALLTAAGLAGLFFRPLPALILLIAVSAVNFRLQMKAKSGYGSSLAGFSSLLKLLAVSDRFQADVLPGHESFVREMGEASRHFSSFRRGAFLLNAGNGTGIGQALLTYVNLFFHLDMIQYNRMLASVKDHKKEAVDLFRAVGTIDAAWSVASYRAAADDWCRPSFAGNEGGLDLKGMHHPLMKEPVPNDCVTETGCLLTGSNASGKSTYLKGCALSAIMAQSAATVPASAYSAPFFQIFTSIALTDNLRGGESYYIVEIRSLKRIADAALAGGRVLAMADEVLRGTNTVERIASSAQILKEFRKLGVIILAATHDIELTYLLEGILPNRHFGETVENGDVAFDYVLREGRAEGRNAIRLLAGAGFPPEVTEGAAECAAHFEETGEWRL